MKRRSSAGVLAVVLGAGPVATVLPSPAEAGEATARRLGASLLERVNEGRQDRSLEPLSAEAALDAAAQAKAAALAAEAGIFQGMGPRQVTELAVLDDLPERLESAGYRAREVKAHLVVTGEALSAALLLETSPSLETDLFDGSLADLGLGVAAVGDLEIVVVICALSAAEDFRRLTRPLADRERVRAELLSGTNEARRGAGRSALRADPCLEHVAQTYADAMLAGGFYGHRSPQGGDVAARAAGCELRRLGENLARGQPTVRAVLADWLDSGGHRRNLLDRSYDRVGFGLALGEDGEEHRILWVQVLGGD